MNVTNLKKTRDHIAAHPDGFDQTRWMHYCGTPGCIAGYAVMACGGTLVPEHHQRDRCMTADGEMMRADEHAEDLLELTGDQSKVMFTAVSYGIFGGQPTAAEALAMLDHAIEHGEVRWPERS